MPEATHVASGKVREIYALGERELLLVASDRISTFDVVLPTEIPDKGRVLTGLSAFWFARTRDDRRKPPPRGPDPMGDRSNVDASRCCPVEFVVRGLPRRVGLGRVPRTRAPICGHALPGPGLVESERLPEPILTPATKAIEGHDLNITEARRRSCAATARTAPPAPRRSRCTEFAADRAEAAGLILCATRSSSSASTRAGVVTLGDEALTPDSSRFWPADEYAPGRPQPSFDKQYVRDWCLATGWDRTPPGPEPAGRRGREAPGRDTSRRSSG